LPLHFILAMRGISRLLLLVIENREFSFHPDCKEIRPRHLSFDDDLMVFYKATKRSIKCMKQLLQRFTNTLGMSINVAKCQKAIAWVFNQVKPSVIGITSFKEGKMPFK